MSLIPPPPPPSTNRVIVEVAYPHPPHLLSPSIAASRPRDNKALTARAHSNEPTQPSPHRAPPRTSVSTTDSGHACRDASQGQQIPVWRIGTAELTRRDPTAHPPKSRWRHRGRGSSISHATAWLIHEPRLRRQRVLTHGECRLSTVSHERTRMLHAGMSKLSWTSQSSSNDQRAQRGRSTGSHSGCPTSYAIPFSSTLRTGSESCATRLA